MRNTLARGVCISSMFMRQLQLPQGAGIGDGHHERCKDFDPATSQEVEGQHPSESFFCETNLKFVQDACERVLLGCWLMVV